MVVSARDMFSPASGMRLQTALRLQRRLPSSILSAPRQTAVAVRATSSTQAPSKMSQANSSPELATEVESLRAQLAQLEVIAPSGRARLLLATRRVTGGARLHLLIVVLWFCVATSLIRRAPPLTNCVCRPR